jgi:hypothetical protein
MNEDGGEMKQCREDVLNKVTGLVLGMFLQHKEHWKKLYGTSWRSVSVLTGGQVLGFHTSGTHLTKWSTIYYNASIDLCIQLNTIGLLQPLSLASRFMPIVSNYCKALVSCTYHNTLTLWYNLTSLGICQPTSVKPKKGCTGRPYHDVK